MGGDGYVLALFAHGHLHELGLLQAVDSRYQVRQTVVVGVLVHEDKEAGIVECLARQHAVEAAEGRGVCWKDGFHYYGVFIG